MADYQTFRCYELFYSRIRLQQKMLVCLPYHMLNIERFVIRNKNDVNLFKAYWLRDATTSLTFNNCTLCPHCVYAFCIYQRTNSDFCHLDYKLIGFYNRDESVYCAVRTGSFK